MRLPRNRPNSEGKHVPYDLCYAKSDGSGIGKVLLADHSLLAGNVADRLLGKTGLKIPPGSPFVVAAHDTGKASPGFLKKICNKTLEILCPELAATSLEGRGWETNHAVMGEAAFRKAYPYVADWGQVVGVHHGSRQQPLCEGCGNYGGAEWAAERAKLLTFLEKNFGAPPENPPTALQTKLVAGLTCVADWIASNDELLPDPATAGRKEIEAALIDAGWRDSTVQPGLCFEQVFPFFPNEMQRDFIRTIDHRGVYVLEAPMGLGKTEAALFAAYKLMESGQNKGLYFGLPTRLTSDRIHQRVEEFMAKTLENPGFVKLIHGHAWMNLESTAAEFKAGQSWFHPRKRALLAPFGVGTIDQALMSVLKVKHHFVRTFGLAGKVVILDEVHSYDAYTGTLLDCLVEELLEIDCSVIILSATLTAKRRTAFKVVATQTQAYPLISTATKTIAPPPSAEKRIRLEYASNELDELFERATAAAEKGCCVLWIANTVAQSQEIFSKINGERREGVFETGLLHSRFPAYRRAEIESVWMEKLGKSGERPNGCILVATQVVEQSVDIDADLLITELAPTDMLLQRIGRLCRHDRSKRPADAGQAWIYGPLDSWSDAESFNEALGKSRYVYAPFVLWKTLQVWRGRTEISLPSQIREFLEATYDETGEHPEWVAELKDQLDAKRNKLRGMALGMTALYCGDDNEDAAPTRYSTCPTISALILQSCDNTEKQADLVLCDGTELTLATGERDFQKAVAIHQNMVTLPFYDKIKPSVPFWLSSLVFGDLLVFKTDGETLLDLDGHERPWGWHPDKGIYRREIQQKQTNCTWKEDDDESYY